jgi:hypothetical protein
MKGSGDWIVDFVGTIETQRDHKGQPVGRRKKGLGKKEVMSGEAVFVRDLRPGEQPDQEFLVHAMGSTQPPRSLRQPVVETVDPANLVPISPDTGATQPCGPILVPVDPITGTPLDHVFPDGSVGCSIGTQDHVILVLSKDDGRILKGSKGEMLAERRGILANLEREGIYQADVYEKARATIEACDPSAEILVMRLPKIQTTKIRRDAFVDCDRSADPRDAKKREDDL